MCYGRFLAAVGQAFLRLGAALLWLCLFLYFKRFGSGHPDFECGSNSIVVDLGPMLHCLCSMRDVATTRVTTMQMQDRMLDCV